MVTQVYALVSRMCSCSRKVGFRQHYCADTLGIIGLRKRAYFICLCTNKCHDWTIFVTLLKSITSNTCSAILSEWTVAQRIRMHCSTAMDTEQPKMVESSETDLNCTGKCVDKMRYLSSLCKYFPRSSSFRMSHSTAVASPVLLSVCRCKSYIVYGLTELPATVNEICCYVRTPGLLHVAASTFSLRLAKDWDGPSSGSSVARGCFGQN